MRLYGTPLQDPVLAGRALKADCVLDGCLQLTADGIRVGVQLVGVDDGATLWAEKYDQAFTDIFALEDSISQRLADVLPLPLTEGYRLRLTKRGTANARAHQHCLRGRYYWNRRTEQGLRSAVDCFNEAIAADPNYALAYAGLADSYVMLASSRTAHSVRGTCGRGRGPRS